MPEKFAKDLLRHAIIPLTGLENSLAAVKALQNVGMLWKVKVLHQLYGNAGQMKNLEY